MALSSPGPARAQAPAAAHVPDEVLVTYRPGVGLQQAAQVAGGLGAGVVETLAASRIQRLRLNGGRSVENAIQALANQPEVEAAQPNYVYYASGPVTRVPASDIKLTDGTLWAMDNYGQSGGTADADIDAPEAWVRATGSRKVVVAVIDSGIDYDHPALTRRDASGNLVHSNVWRNPGETGTDSQGRDMGHNNVDDDNNGYIDDVHGINGRVPHTGSGPYPAGDPMDDNQHGTHVAGTIGAIGNDGDELPGVSWQVSMVACKFLGADRSGTTLDAIKCLKYVHALKQSGVPVIATNNSWGGGPYDQALKDAIEESNRLGILFVAAAGNGDWLGRAINVDSSPQYPASYNTSNMISVTATDRADRKASFGNYGAKTIHVGAPGVDILSCIPRSMASGGGTPYKVLSGTSMAAPHVTGALAVLAAHAAALSPEQLRYQILNTGDKIASLATTTSTGRRLNLNDLLSGGLLAAQTGDTPAAPTDLAAAPDPASPYSRVRLSWYDPSVNATGFRVERSNGATTTVAGYVSAVPGGGATLSFTDAGLAASTTYTYEVCAYNGFGTSAPAVSSHTTGALPPPAAPTGLAAKVISASRIDLSWTDKSDNETGFRIERLDGAPPITVGANVTAYSATGLAASTTYTFQVVAYNTAGSSSPAGPVSATTSAAPTVPDAPSGLTATPVSSTQINLAWTDNSSNESGFRIERSTGSSWSLIASVGAGVSSYANGGLSRGKTYYYRVRAYNSVGNSAYSDTAKATTLR